MNSNMSLVQNSDHARMWNEGVEKYAKLKSALNSSNTLDFTMCPPCSLTQPLSGDGLLSFAYMHLILKHYQ